MNTGRFNVYHIKRIQNNKKPNFNKKSNFHNNNNDYDLYKSSLIPKTNKTIQKYINEKLNIINKNNQKVEKPIFIQKNKPNPNIIYKKVKNNYSLNQRKNPKSKDGNIKQNIMDEKINIQKSNSNNKNNYYYDTNNKNKENNTTFMYNISEKRKQNEKKSKLINSGSTSAGQSISSNNKMDESAKLTYFEYNNDKYNIGYKSIENKNNINSNITYDKVNTNKKRFFFDDPNYIRPSINNFNYETGSDDNINENTIFLKYDNYSSLTFGNSFSYSNSNRSKSTKRNNNINNNNINNDENTNNNNITFFAQYNNKNKNYVNKLKEENEALKKELKYSNDQISLLKDQIKELKAVNIKKNSRNAFLRANIWNKNHIKYEILENGNFNDIKNTKEFSLDLDNNEKIKFKKNFFDENNNNTINWYNNNSYAERKIINVKKNLNLKRKIHRKNQDEFSSLSFLDKPCENINECISNLKI